MRLALRPAPEPPPYVHAPIQPGRQSCYRLSSSQQWLLARRTPPHRLCRIMHGPDARARRGSSVALFYALLAAAQ